MFCEREEPQIVQDLFSELESIIQKHFVKDWESHQFIKGVGDGFMVVVELDDNSSEQDHHIMIKQFIKTCYSCEQDMAENLRKHDLRVGFGIEVGALNHFLMLGRWDYIGDAVNKAAKYQGKAENEIVISEVLFSNDEISGFLKQEGWDIKQYTAKDKEDENFLEKINKKLYVIS